MLLKLQLSFGPFYEQPSLVLKWLSIFPTEPRRARFRLCRDCKLKDTAVAIFCNLRDTARYRFFSPSERRMNEIALVIENVESRMDVVADLRND